jgi:hypothetical protein
MFRHIEGHTEEQLVTIQVELIEIREGYFPTMPWDAPNPDTFYITATYNQRHSDEPLDGNEVEYILASGWLVPEPIIEPVEEQAAIEEGEE